MNLRQLRKAKKLSQQQVADILNVSQRTYSGYECETSEPSILILTKLADFYGVTIDYLVGREVSGDVGFLSPKQRNIILASKGLNDENLDKIMGQILKLSNEQKNIKK